MSSAGQDEDKKPGDSSTHINVKVKGQTPKVRNEFMEFYEAETPIRVAVTQNSQYTLDIADTQRVFNFLKDGNEVFFRIKKGSQLKKLMTTYCDRQSVDLNAIAFLFDGRRLRAEQTPDELEMEDGDEIDAMLHQTGGSAAA